MDATTRAAFEELRTGNREAQSRAYYTLMDATAAPVSWAYEIWDELVAMLRHKDNHLRAVAAQLLCNLAQSDPDQRMMTDFPALLAVTRDDRFVTARHCLQAIWKVGTVGLPQQQMVMAGLEARFRECITEKNGTLIRYDIIQDLKNLYDATQDETIRAVALALIDSEDDPKYSKKYASVWRQAKRAKAAPA